MKQVIAGYEASLFVTIELRRGRVFRGLVQVVKARGDAVEISWHGAGIDLISSDEVAVVSVSQNPRKVPNVPAPTPPPGPPGCQCAERTRTGGFKSDYFCKHCRP